MSKVMKERQMQALRETFQENQGKEYMLGHWHELVNTKLPNYYNFSNTKSLGKAISVLKKCEGYIIKKKITKLQTKYKTYTARFYKFVGGKNV